MTTLLVLQLLLALRPDVHLTPGQAWPANVCTTKWGLDARHVTRKMKRDIATLYHLPPDRAQWSSLVFDHLIPRELGGTDTIANVWPQARAESYRKDRLEKRLHALVCKGQLSLAEAQTQIATDWVAAAMRYGY